MIPVFLGHNFLLLGLKKLTFNFKMLLNYCFPKLQSRKENNTLIKLGMKNDE